VTENEQTYTTYLDYIKSKSLSEYSQKAIKLYISKSSKEEVTAIDELGQRIGLGKNVLLGKFDCDEERLYFLNKNIDIQVEQKRLTNLLHENLGEILRLPDNNKERLQHIELGLKYFIKANKDNGLYADALEEFKLAEKQMKQDYFILYLIGLIYLFSPKHLDPVKAIDYFTRSAKYVVVESDPKAIRLVNVLRYDPIKEEKRWIELRDYEDKYEFNELRDDEEGLRIDNLWDDLGYIGWYIEKSSFLLYTTKKEMDDGNKCKPKDKIYFADLLNNKNVNKIFKKRLIEITEKIDSINSKYDVDQYGLKKLQLLYSDSYSKGAFAAYVLGDFEVAVSLQEAAEKYNSSAENLFFLAKYQIRTKQIDLSAQNLSKSIDDNCLILIAAFKDLDLIGEQRVRKLIKEKNDVIDKKINSLIHEFKTNSSNSAKKATIELNQLLNLTYDKKVKVMDEYDSLKSSISLLKENLRTSIFLSLNNKEIVKLIEKLNDCLNKPFDDIKKVYENISQQFEKDRVKIGSQYAGGIVFYLDESNNHGMVAAEKDQEIPRLKKGNILIGKGAVVCEWGDKGEINTKTDVGQGKWNTKLIAEQFSNTFAEVGYFSKKVPVTTFAKFCYELSLNGYSDWFLPSKDELNLMYLNLHKKNIGGFMESMYVSSSSFSSERAWLLSFQNGSYLPFDKSFLITILVRPARAF